MRVTYRHHIDALRASQVSTIGATVQTLLRSIAACYGLSNQIEQLYIDKFNKLLNCAALRRRQK